MALSIAHTGPVISWAAAIMVTVFLAFLSVPILDIKETGLPLAIAVLLDATLVRLILAPARARSRASWPARRKPIMLGAVAVPNP